MLLFNHVDFLGQEDYVKQAEDTMELSERLICRYSKRAAAKCDKMTAKSRRMRIRLLAQFSKAEDELLNNLCAINERQAETLLRNSLYSYRSFEALLNDNSAGRLKMKNSELDSTALAIGFVDSTFQNGCNCEGLAELKRAKIELDDELRQSSLTANYISKRKQYLTKVAGHEKSMLGSLKSIEKADYYFNTSMREYSSVFQDRTSAEKMFFQALRKSLSRHLPSSVPVACSQLETAIFAEPLPTLNEVKKQFEEAAQQAGKSTTELLSPNDVISEKVFDEKLRKTILEDNELKLKKEDVLEMAQKDSTKANEKEHIVTDSTIANKTEWKKNPLKFKRFRDRMIYGLSFQANPRTSLFPVSGVVNGQLGFQVTTNINVGVGGSYLVGFDKHRVSSSEINQPFTTSGYSIRSTANHRLKGPVYLQGNFELTKQNPVSVIHVRREDVPLNRAFLIGLKVKTSKGKRQQQTIEVYYDFMHNQTKQPAFVLRLGMEFIPKHAYNN